MKNKKLVGGMVFVIGLFLLFFIVLWVTCGSTIDEAIEALPEPTNTLEDAYQKHLDATR
ncbi:hypothetical protein ES703_59981 [subsurface metagenome]